MAIPKKLVARGMALGDNGFSTSTIDLLPASANSQTTYGPGDRVLFSVPNYARSFIDFSKSFIKYDIQTRTSTGQLRPTDNIPWIERVQVRCGATTIEDISNYFVYERIMSQLSKTGGEQRGWLFGDYSAYDYGTAVVPLATAFSTANGGVSSKARYIKRLYCSIMSNDQYLFPIHRLNAGNQLEFEFTLSSNELVLQQVGGTAVADYGYTISNVRLQLHLVKASDSFIRKFNEMTSNEELVLPSKVVRHHMSMIPAGQQDSVVFINHNSKNLERIFTTFRRPSTEVSQGPFQVFVGDSPGDTARLASYQYEYMARQYPQSPCEGGGDFAGAAEYLANLLIAAGHDFIDLPDVCRSEFGIAIGQNFKYSDDLMVNGLNTNASGSPVTLRLRFKNPVTAALMVESFCESTGEIVIGETGGVSLVQRSNMLSE